jgi:hypothetical protein
MCTSVVMHYLIFSDLRTFLKFYLVIKKTINFLLYVDFLSLITIRKKRLICLKPKNNNLFVK